VCSSHLRSTASRMPVTTPSPCPCTSTAARWRAATCSSASRTAPIVACSGPWATTTEGHPPVTAPRCGAGPCVNDAEGRDRTIALLTNGTDRGPGGAVGRALGGGEEQGGVYGGAVQVGAEVQVGTGDAAGRPDRADARTGPHRAAFRHLDGGEVAIHRHEPLPVIDDDGVAVEVEIPGDRDLPVGGGGDRRARRRGDVHALVRRARLVVEPAAEAEARAAATRDR